MRPAPSRTRSRRGCPAAGGARVRMRVFAVPSGIRSRSATSTWVRPAKKASSSATRCASGSGPDGLDDLLATHVLPGLPIDVVRGDLELEVDVGRPLAMGLLASHQVDRLVPGQRVQPGAERAARRVEPAGVAPDRHEDVLDDLLGEALRPRHLVGERVERDRCSDAYSSSMRSFVAFADPSQETGIGRPRVVSPRSAVPHRSGSPPVASATGPRTSPPPVEYTVRPARASAGPTRIWSDGRRSCPRFAAARATDGSRLDPESAGGRIGQPGRARASPGSRTLSRAPRGATFSARASPPWARASSRTIARPEAAPGRRPGSDRPGRTARTPARPRPGRTRARRR